MIGLRIIGGTFGGRKLIAPPGLDTRPLPDRIKQSLFDWLGQDLSDLRVADVCAGSGGFGIEAFSRGATEVHLIEAGRHALPALTANLRAIGTPAAVKLHQKTFQTALPALRDLDLIFADPPFPWFTEEPQTLSELLTQAAASLAPQGELVLRGERGFELPPLPRTLRKTGERFYGRSWIGRYALLRQIP
jgi:16S rRNA (guanine966-N2)-methyltransferase